MAYQNNIPQPGTQISVSQNDLLNNFLAINTIIDPNNAFINLSTTTAPEILAGNIGLYTIVDPRIYPAGQTPVNELYFKRDTLAGLNGIPLSGGKGFVTPLPTFVTSGATAVSCGWYNLPNGSWVKYGYITALTTVAIINLDLIGPLYRTGVDNVQVSINSSILIVSWDFPNQHTLQISQVGTGTPDCYFFVIGR